MGPQTGILQNVRLGGFGHSADEDAATAGREAVRGALGGRAPAAGDLVVIFPSAAYDLQALHAAAMDEAGAADVVSCTTVGASPTRPSSRSAASLPTSPATG